MKGPKMFCILSQTYKWLCQPMYSVMDFKCIALGNMIILLVLGNNFFVGQPTYVV